jgi:hypothetical protein
MVTKPVAGAGLPSAEDLDKVAAEQKAKDATGPAPTGPDVPAGASLGKEPDSNVKDSRGAAKETKTPIGGRGVNAPRDAKPAPTDKEKRAAQPKVTVTDKVDNAGNPKDPAPHGIRGLHTSRDTYRT